VGVRVDLLEPSNTGLSFKCNIGLDMDSTILALLELAVAISCTVLPHVHVVLEWHFRVVKCN